MATLPARLLLLVLLILLPAIVTAVAGPRCHRRPCCASLLALALLRRLRLCLRGRHRLCLRPCRHLL